MKTTTTTPLENSSAAQLAGDCTAKPTTTALYDGRLGVPDHLAGIFAEDQLKAEGILEFACPTKGADGKWYRCTLATTNVPVAELYNILTNINMVAQRLREVGGPPVEYLVRELEELHSQIKARDKASNAEVRDPAT
jgi:hypothetical protein